MVPPVPPDPAYDVERILNEILRKTILISGAIGVLTVALHPGVHKHIAQYIHDNMVTAKELTDLFAAVTALIEAESALKTSSDAQVAEIATLKQNITDITAQVADLGDPALEAQTLAMTQAAANATPGTPTPTPANPS